MKNVLLTNLTDILQKYDKSEKTVSYVRAKAYITQILSRDWRDEFLPPDTALFIQNIRV